MNHPFKAASSVLVVLMSSVFAGCEISDKDIKYVGVSEVRQLQVRAEREPKTLLLVDPRSPAAYARERLPGAMHMEFRSDMKDRGVDRRLSSHRNIVVYGDNPGSAAARGMTKRLMLVGYDNVRLFAGGVEEWKTMRYPVEGDAASE